MHCIRNHFIGKKSYTYHRIAEILFLFVVKGDDQLSSQLEEQQDHADEDYGGQC